MGVRTRLVRRNGDRADSRTDGRVLRHRERILRLDENGVWFGRVRGQYRDPDTGHLGGLVSATVPGRHQQPVDARPELRGPYLARVTVQPERCFRVLAVGSCK